jgi:hypothetical protein
VKIIDPTSDRLLRVWQVCLFHDLYHGLLMDVSHVIAVDRQCSSMIMQSTIRRGRLRLLWPRNFADMSGKGRAYMDLHRPSTLHGARKQIQHVRLYWRDVATQSHKAEDAARELLVAA